MRKSLYWLISLFVVVAIFVLIFGVIGSSIIESRADHVKVFASLIAIVGLVLVMFSIHSVRTLWNSVLKKPGSDNAVGGDNFGAFVLGLSFIIGALVYSRVRDSFVLTVAFGIAVVLIRIRVANASSQRKDDV